MKKLLLTTALGLTGMFSAIASITVTVSTTAATCNGACNGAIAASASGGSGSYTFAWNGPSGPFGGGGTVTGLCAGSYTVTATDMSDMTTATAVTTVTEPPPFTVSMPSGAIACPGSCVALNPSISGGVPGYTYSWVPGTDLSDPFAMAPTSCPAVSHTYTLTVTDANGCLAIGTMTMYIDSPITANFSVTNATACGMCDGSVTTATMGGSAPYSYLWSNGYTGPGTISSLCAGVYSVTITDANGCTANDTATVSAPPLYPDFTVVPDSANGYGIWTFNSTTGTGMSYSWNFDDGLIGTGVNPTHVYTSPGTYNVCLTANSFLGCSTVVCHPVTITGTPASCLALFNIGDDVSSSDPNDLTVYNLSYGATLSYLWDFGDGSTSTLRDPAHVYAGMGPYQLCLTVDNGSGCTQMYCDSIMSVDSLGRSTNLSLHTEEAPAPVTTGITEATANTAVDVYPNPAVDRITFRITSAKDEVYALELTDVLGNKVKTLSGISKKEFSVSREGLQNGVYFYKVYTPGKTLSMGRLVLQ